MKNRKTAALVVVHALVVAALTAFLLVTEALQPDDVPDANIGGALAFLALGAWGFPWSVPAFVGPVDRWGVRIAWVVSAATINVVLHAGWQWRASRASALVR